jgi:hypothetical protein
MTVDIILRAIDQTKTGFDSAAKNAQGFNTAISAANKRLGENYVASQQSAKEIDALNKKYQDSKKPIEKTTSALSNLTAGYKFLMGTVLGMGAVQLTKQTYNFARLGAEVGYTQIKFDRLAASVGTSGNTFLDQLRGATKGTVSDFALLKQGSDLLQLGLAKDSAEATRLSRVMTALGMDTGELTLALANQSKRRLDQLGLSLSKFNEIEAKLKDRGMNKQDAFKEAFIQTAEQTVATTGNMADTKLGDFMRLEASWANYKNQMALNMASSATDGGLTNFLSSQATALAVKQQYKDYLKNNPKAGKGTLFSTPYGREYTYNKYNAGMLDSDPRFLADAQKYANERRLATSGAGQLAAMQSYYGGGGSYGDVAPTDYATLLEGALKITAQTEKFDEATASLNQTLAEETTKLSEIKKKYGENSDEVEKQTGKIEDIKSEIKSVGQSAKKTGDAMLMSTMQNMGASDQQALEFARASGMITDQAFIQQSALNKISEAYLGTALTAAQAANAGRTAMSLVKGMDGMYSVAQIDIIVNTIYTSSVFGGAKGLNRQNNAAVQNCFAADTLILMADGTSKPIQDVQVMEWVTSYDIAKGDNIRAQVVDVYHHPVETMGDYYLLVNNHIQVTPNHPLFINGTWQEAGLLKVGDTLRSVDGNIATTSVIRVYSQIATYNLHIDDENHNYYADGILAHNKAGGGRVSAPGDGTRDTILVPLANDEFVVNARQSRKFMPLLEAINNGRVGIGLAGGGTVGGRSTSRTSRGTRGARGTASGLKGISASFDYFSGSGGGDMMGDTISAIIPEVSEAVSSTVSQTIAQSAQMQALESSLAAQREQVEILTALLEKTASATDIGRAVKHSVYTQA